MIKRVGEKEIFKSKLFTIKDIELELSDETRVVHQIVEKRDTAMIVPVTQNQEVIFIREYFGAISKYALSLPKGSIDKGSDALQTANKELQEEIGYKAKRLDKLGVLTMSPGYLSQKTHVFLARDLMESKLDGDELEELEIISYPFDRFEELITQGELTEARTIAALYLARNKLFTKRENV